MATVACSAQLRLAPPPHRITDKLALFSHPRHLGWTARTPPISLICNSSSDRATCNVDSRFVVKAQYQNPPIMPFVMTPGGALDLSWVLFRNRIIFIGQPIYSEVAQKVISELVTLATIDESADIMIYINSPGGSLYSCMAIYDCMSWVKPKVGTVCFGSATSHAAFILAGGEKGMRYAMPNARIMIHEPQGSCEGTLLDVKVQANESVYLRHKMDHMFAAFTGQTLETVQMYTTQDCYMSPAEAMDFGLIDGLFETVC